MDRGRGEVYNKFDFVAKRNRVQRGSEMGYNKKLIAEKLTRWEKYITNYDLPGWEQLPHMQLYMDQVVTLISEYLSHFVYSGNDEKLLTPSMVNNYVKLGVVPPPVKKRYSRPHIACLLMVCVLKQTLPMAVVAKMISCGDEERVRRDYESFVAIHKRLAQVFSEQVRLNAAPVFDESVDSGSEVRDLVMSAAVTACLAKLLTAKIIALQSPDGAEGGEQSP